MLMINDMDKEEIEKLKSCVKNSESTRRVHIPYENTTGRKPDFEVQYNLNISPDLVGVNPAQGMRCDFLYDGDDPKIDCIYQIWPELLDEKGDVILDKSIPITPMGMATMWIGSQEMREKIHQKRIKVGVNGYWVIGSQRLAKVTVTKIIGLFENG